MVRRALAVLAFMGVLLPGALRAQPNTITCTKVLGAVDSTNMPTGDAWRSLYFDPDGDTIVTTTVRGTLGFWNPEDGTLRGEFRIHENEYGSVRLTLSPDGKYLVSSGSSASGYPEMKILRMSDRHVVATIDSAWSYAFDVSPASNVFAAIEERSGERKFVTVRRLSDGMLLSTVAGNSYGTSAVTISQDGLHIITGGGDGDPPRVDRTIKVWRISDGALVRTIAGHQGGIYSLACTPDSQYIVSASVDGTVRVWRLSDGAFVRYLTTSCEDAGVMAISPDGKFAAFLSSPGVVVKNIDDSTTVWATRTDNQVNAIAFSPNGGRLIICDRKPQLHAWNLSDGRLLWRAPVSMKHIWYVTDVAVSPDGTFLVSASYDRTAIMWRLPDGVDINVLREHADAVNAVAVSPDNQYVFTGSLDKLIRMWSVADGALVRTFTGHAQMVNGLSVSPDGTTLASVSDDKTIRFWRISDGTQVASWAGHGSMTNTVAFSPDGAYLLTGSGDGTPTGDNTLRVWQVSGRTLVRTLTGHTDYVTKAVYTSDGAIIVSGSGDGTVRIWRASDGTLLRTIVARIAGWGGWVAVSPDGQYVATVGGEKIIRIFRISDGSPLWTLSGHTMSIWSVAFSPDGRFLVSGSRDYTVRIWQIDPPMSRPLAVRELAGPPRFSLSQNAPNPFNPTTVIRYSLAQPGKTRLAIYDVNGRLVRVLVDEARTAGVYEVVWDGTDAAGRSCASGVYVYRLVAKDGTIVRRMTMVR